MSLGEIAARLDLAPSTVHGIIRTLLAHGMVAQERDSQRYRLGPATLRLGNVYLDTLELRSRVSSWAEDLARRTGCAVRTGVLLLGDVVVVHHEPRPDGTRQMPEVGIVIPAHACALGKALLAFDPDAVADTAELTVAQHDRRDDHRPGDAVAHSSTSCAAPGSPPRSRRPCSASAAWRPRSPTRSVRSPGRSASSFPPGSGRWTRRLSTRCARRRARSPASSARRRGRHPQLPHCGRPRRPEPPCAALTSTRTPSPSRSVTAGRALRPTDRKRRNTNRSRYRPRQRSASRRPTKQEEEQIPYLPRPPSSKRADADQQLGGGLAGGASQGRRSALMARRASMAA